MFVSQGGDDAGEHPEEERMEVNSFGSDGGIKQSDREQT